MVKVAIRYLIDEKPDVAVEADLPNGLSDSTLNMLWTVFIQLIKIRRGSEPTEPQPTAQTQPQPTPGCEPT